MLVTVDQHLTHLNLDTSTSTDIDRRESSSSRSTSAFISTPIDSLENLDQMYAQHHTSTSKTRPHEREREHNHSQNEIPAVMNRRSIRRIGRQERTKSWLEQHAHLSGDIDGDGDRDGLLRPPSQGPSRRSSQILDPHILDRPITLDTTLRPRYSWSSHHSSSSRLSRRVRTTSEALSHSTARSETGDETNISSAELGRRIIAREREQREQRYAVAGRLSTKAQGDLCADTIRNPKKDKKVVEKEKEKEVILSIDELVKRHKEAMDRPSLAAKDKARKELGIAPATAIAAASSRSTSASTTVVATTSEKRNDDTPRPTPGPATGTPVIPTRKSSSPAAQPGFIPSRVSSKTDIVSLGLSRSTSDNRSTTTGSGSVTRDALLNQAALEQLELGDNSRSPSRCSRKVSFQAHRSPSRLRKERDRPSMTPSRKSTPSISVKEDEAQEALAVALYLRTPNLNRYFTIPRQSPDPPLRVSVAEVGSLTGAPVLMFLGLGCVRYLTALFDDLAKALDLRLICIDRWGYGKTDMVEESKRGLREWAAIVERVVDEMNIKQFSVLAHSAGCPYALAAATRMKERLVGKIHLLAPWVGTDVDNSYKWLKWVPNGIIKSATAAEWRLQSYFLGKPPPLTYSPIGYNARTASSTNYLPLGTSRNASMLSVAGNPLRKPSLLHRASSIVLRTKNTNIDTIPEPEYVSMAEMMDVQSGILPMAPIPTGRAWKGIESENSNRKEGKKKDDKERLKPPGHDVPWGNLHSDYNKSSTSIHRVTSNNGPPLDFGLSEGFGEFPQEMIPKSKPLDTDSSSPQPKRKGFSAYSYSYSYSYSRSPNASTSTSTSTSASTKKTDRPSSPSPPSGPSFGVALQQASHAECEPGTTSDLLSIVLGRQHANRPWQYALNYADFSLPVKIYWGQEDDKISEKSVRWMEKTMTSGVELLVLEGEGHNLMTSSGTMLSVFQSLREEISMAALGPQPDLRFY